LPAAALVLRAGTSSSSSSAPGTTKTLAHLGQRTFLPGVSGLAGLRVAPHSGQSILTAMAVSLSEEPRSEERRTSNFTHRNLLLRLSPDADARSLSQNAHDDLPLEFPADPPDRVAQRGHVANQEHRP